MLDRRAASSGEPLLTPEDVAEFLRVSPRTLERWRWAGGGPPFHRVGGLCRYAKGDLESWVAAGRNGSSPGPTRRSRSQQRDIRGETLATTRNEVD